MLNNATIVGLAGKAGHGKSEVSKVFRRVWMADGDFNTDRRDEIELAFADPIKDAIGAILQLDRRTLEYWKRVDDPVPPLHKNMRYLLQTLGTDWGRCMVQDDIWLQVWRLRADNFASLNAGKKVLIVAPDVRFQNEVDLINTIGGVVIRVVRPGVEDAQAAGHASEEQALAGLYMTIVNDGSLSELHGKAVQAYYKVVEEK